MEKGFYPLSIDEEFRSMIRPLRHDEYTQLEVNLTIDGCLNPIITWHGFIVDGHNRYEICNRLRIPYAVQEIYLETRDEVIIWICTHQLGRRNISEETRRYLIGKKYASEKAVITNPTGHNQYSSQEGEDNLPVKRESGRRTAIRIGQEHQVSPSLVQKYYDYSRALDAVSEKDPEIKPLILSGNLKISHENLVALSKKDAEEVKKINKKLTESQGQFVRYSESRRIMTGQEDEKPPEKQSSFIVPGIKRMPQYDPDADADGLSLTIPSWISSIKRVKHKANLEDISLSAKANLKKNLYNLQNSIAEMLADIKEDEND